MNGRKKQLGLAISAVALGVFLAPPVMATVHQPGPVHQPGHVHQPGSGQGGGVHQPKPVHQPGPVHQP